MKKAILLLFFTSKIFSQTYELNYQCSREFNNENYNLIQQFDETKYSYTVEKILEESMNSDESKVSITICLNPETLKTENIISDNMDYFYSELDYFRNVIRDKTVDFNVEFIPNNQTKEIELEVYGVVSKQKISEYTLQSISTKEALYKVWFLDNSILEHNMLYNKRQLMVDWSIIYFAFKYSKMKRLIYSVQQIGKNREGLTDTNIFESKLLYIKEVDGVYCKNR